MCAALRILELTLRLLVRFAQVRVLVEQPQSSLMSRHPRWLFMIDRIGVALWQLTFPMACFGAKSLKPTTVYSSDKALLELLGSQAAEFDRKSFKASVQPTTTRDGLGGQKKVTGVSKVLKATQAYPEGFGAALAGHAASGTEPPRQCTSAIIECASDEDEIAAFNQLVDSNDDVWSDVCASVSDVTSLCCAVAPTTQACILDVARYLRKGRHLQVPPAWATAVSNAYGKLRRLHSESSAMQI